MIIECKICKKNLSSGGFGGHLNMHIKNGEIISKNYYAYKYYKCKNYEGDIKYEYIMRIDNNRGTYEYPNGFHDHISNIPTIAKTNQHMASYIKRKYNLKFDYYIKKYFKNIDDIGDKKCVLCDEFVEKQFIIDYDKCTYKYELKKTCNTEKCKKKIFKKLYPNKQYSAFNFSKIGCKSEYISLVNSISIEEAKNKKYNDPDTKFYGKLEDYINKYGVDKGTKVYNDRCKKISENGNMSLKYHINKCGDYELGLKSYIDRIDAFTKVSKNHRSKLECKIYSELIKYIPTLKQTKRIYCDERIYYVDMLLKEKNIVIEIMGDYWHCNPEIYKEDYYNKTIKKYAYEIWEKDLNRKKDIEYKNFIVIEIWEKDYNEKPQKTIDELLEKINEY